MKFSWFHLMPYTELPEDFREKHNSVWVDIDSRLFDPARAHLMYNEFLDELEYAADVGFDAVCVNEHHGNGYGLMPSPNLIASSLARRTSDAAICVLGNSLSLYNPPLRVAEEFAMIDCISGGRLIAGFPVGTPMDTCYAYGQNPSQLRQRYLEAHDLIVRAWREPEPFAFNGRFNKLRYVNLWPRPVQKPRPPIWIPGGGAAETLRWCGENDYLFAALSYFGYDSAKGVMGAYWKEIDDLGKPRNPFRAGYLQFVGVAESRAEAMKIYKEPAEYFYSRCLHVDPKYANPAGYTTESTIRRRVTSQIDKVAAANANPVAAHGGRQTIEQIVDRGYLVVGSPDEVAEQLRTICTDLNVGNLMLLMQFGNMGKDLAQYNTRLFAEGVIPQLRDLFEDQWENAWFPTPLARERRAVPAAAVPSRQAAE
jgi:alkanesulfonate monooxygenase SsuD/methylene tetrahydromethanopterin reductase-like flavin-dependent oxidoreductase (luciferase family)